MKLIPSPVESKAFSVFNRASAVTKLYTPVMLSNDGVDVALMSIEDGLMIIEPCTSSTDASAFVGILYPINSSPDVTQVSDRWQLAAGKGALCIQAGERIRARIDGAIDTSTEGTQLVCGADGLVKLPTSAGTYFVVAHLLKEGTIADGDYPYVLVVAPYPVVVPA